MVQADDYYPFGLTFNSYKSGLENKWKFQGQEHITDLDLNWVSFKWRNHQPDLGRFFNVDPLAEDYYHNSPYAFSENKVTAHVELEGLESHYAADGNIVANGPLKKEAVASANISYLQNKRLSIPNKDLGHLRNKSAWVSQKIMNRPAVACYRTSKAILQYANINGGDRGPGNSNVIQTAQEENGKLNITEFAQAGADYLKSQVKDGGLVLIGLDHTLGNKGNYDNTTDHFVVVDGLGYDQEKEQVFFTFNEVNNANEKDAKSEKNRLYLNEDGSLTGTNYKGTKTFTVSQVRKNQSKEEQ